MADNENCVPVSIGFVETVLISARIECLGRRVCVLEGSHPVTTCGISFARTWFAKNQLPSQAPGWITTLGIAHLNPSEAERMLCPVTQLKLYIRDSKESGGGGGGASTDVYSLESQHQGYHEPMDRGDCQGSLHTSWSRVWPSYGTWGQSTVSIMGVQLSGGPTWHPVSGVLEVIWGLPEFVSAGHGLYRWWHVYYRSSGGPTASCGSRTSSPSSIAYTICMQPLLQHS